MERYNTYGIKVKDFAIIMLKTSKLGRFFLFTGIILLMTMSYLSVLFILIGILNLFITLKLNEKKELIISLTGGVIYHTKAAIIEKNNYNDIYNKNNYNDIYNKNNLLCRTINTETDKYVTKIYISGIYIASYLYFIRNLPFSDYK